jgi:hypothetical protein
VFFFEIAVDGVELKKRRPHSSQIFMMRAAAVPEWLRYKARNVQPLLIIPGPKAPKSFDRFWHLILELMLDSSPQKGIDPAPLKI